MNGTGTTTSTIQAPTMHRNALASRSNGYAKARVRTQGARGLSLTSSYERYCLNMHHDQKQQQHLERHSQDTKQHIHNSQRNTSHTHMTAVA